jgi:hypothetical protein
MKDSTPLVFVLVLLAACAAESDPQAIVDRAIEAHGGDVLRHSIVSFDFRGRHFQAARDGGRFTYERRFTDSTGSIRDVLTNDDLYREVDGRRVVLTEERLRSVERGVNSVLYFALLPFNLNDPAVQKRYLGATEIEGEPYHEVEVTFRQEGGGRDYQDRFVYWFHARRHTMDYLAYTFEEDGGGTRFRKALNPRTVGGVRFADYANYTADTLGRAIERYDDLLPTGTLTPFSAIVLENIRVQPLPAAR